MSWILAGMSDKIVSAHRCRMRSCSDAEGIVRGGARVLLGNRAARAVRRRVGKSAGSSTCVWIAWDRNLEHGMISQWTPSRRILERERHELLTA
jgi:hypothetical protein